MASDTVVLTGAPPTPLRAVLVANRGEIAVRVLRAARDAGLGAYAVHAPGEGDALHVRSADAAVEVPSYLSAEALVAAALTLGADAVHPGYGFLAEDADFAQAVQDAGLVWIGPPPAAIRMLGDKVAARSIAREVGAPLAPGSAGTVGYVAEIEAFATKHGLPLVIKAAGGGGGRGIKVVHDAADIPTAFAAAVREAESSFGRGECFVERYVTAARHVEAQVLADAQGAVVVVGTRDCSLQRRNQKLVEEAPAPFLTSDQFEAVTTSAQAICRAAGYVGAGTVEYLVGGDGSVSFLEVNTRLQVEHPVTEAVTGVDLVLEQFRIAGGATLLSTDPPAVSGHAFEFRLNAEDPGAGFRPTPGPLTRLDLPAGPGIRIDAGVTQGDAIDGRYDSMFAKLIVSGPDRAAALARARRALAEVRIDGIPTPVPFYRLVLDEPAFTATDGVLGVHNRWIEEEFTGVLEPWAAPVTMDGGLPVRVGRRTMSVELPGLAALPDGGAAVRANAAELAAKAAAPTGPEVRAPMQGTIVAVAVKDGDRVEVGDLIAVLEAMKMENPVTAHRAGTVTGLTVQPGDTAPRGAVLCEVKE